MILSPYNYATVIKLYIFEIYKSESTDLQANNFGCLEKGLFHL
ncbi:hypothetical protein IWX80_002594 [Flavobacterium sp. CAN_S2]